jgi:hypothetical protein
VLSLIDIMFESYVICPLRHGLSYETNRGLTGPEP